MDNNNRRELKPKEKSIKKNLTIFQKDLDNLNFLMDKYGLDASEVFRQLMENQRVWEQNKKKEIMKIEEVVKNITKLEASENLENDIIEAFEGYSYKNETEVIVNKDESNTNIDFQAYINKEDSQIIKIKIENKIIKAWI